MTGTAALLRASGVAFDVLRFAGIAYLLVMAVMTWRDRSPLVVSDDQPAKGSAHVIGSAILSNALNPKLTVFFFAFLPQFVPPGSHHELTSLLLLSGVFMVMTFVVFAAYGILAASVRRHLVERPRVVVRLRRLIAASFVGLGVKLATTSR